jgi:eukaryotic-like serine/threonine-protein kinase
VADGEDMRRLNERYRLEHRIAVGGASEVWRGHDEVLGRPVAVKVVPPGRQYTESSPDELVRAEARSAAALTHPNIAGVYDFGACPAPSGLELRYIVMELAEGETLASHLRGGPLDWQIAVRVCAEVSAALAAAHLRGLVHRDIKPANVMLTPYGAKVLDFGISIMAGNHDSLPDGTVVGTPAFMPPERFRGLPAAPATDMYALGVLLYLCLAGRLPWPVSPEPGGFVAPAAPPPPLPEIPGLPVEVAEVCASCLDPEPERRPSSFVAALLLAEAVDARVHLPPVAPEGGPSTSSSLSSEPTMPSWTRAAAEAQTDVAPQAGPAPRVDPLADLPADLPAEPEPLADPRADLSAGSLAEPFAERPAEVDPLVDALADLSAEPDPLAEPVPLAAPRGDLSAGPLAEPFVERPAEPDPLADLPPPPLAAPLAERPAAVDPLVDALVELSAEPDPLAEPSAEAEGAGRPRHAAGRHRA